MSYCTKCGGQLPEGAKFCTKCWNQLIRPTEKAGAYDQATFSKIAKDSNYAVHNISAEGMQRTQISGRYEPIGMWDYFLYDILFLIPLVGIILLIIFSVGGTENKNLRNYARSFFCIKIIWIIILAILAYIFGGIVPALTALFIKNYKRGALSCRFGIH